MFAWLPIIGPIIEGIVSAYNKTKDVQLATHRINAETHSADVNATTQVIVATKDDTGIKVARDLLIYPVIIWTDLIVWDKIVDTRYPDLVWGVSNLPPLISMLPYAVMVFLLGLAAMSPWKR